MLSTNVCVKVTQELQRPEEWNLKIARQNLSVQLLDLDDVIGWKNNNY